MLAGVGELAASVTWVFGRDGFLTAKDQDERWWAGCSLPKRAAETMLKKLEVRGAVGCLLAPTHAGQVMTALEKLSARQAVVVVQPDAGEMGVMLGCRDFSEEIRRNRLWFVAGHQWPSMMTELFAKRPGLSTPCQFIRTPATGDEVVQQLIPMAEKVFGECNDIRAVRISGCREIPSAKADSSKRILLIAASHFRLWDDAGAALLSAFGDGSVRHLDPDDPAQSSALGLALAAQDCDAVVVPNRSRGELPDVLPLATPVVSWITQPRIPAFDGRHAKDALLLADEAWVAVAQGMGWPRDRVQVAGWPTMELPPAGEKCLALIADTRTLETPVTKLDASSHHVLWELIRRDLAADPFSVGPDVNGFIDRRMAKLGISEEGFDRGMFIEKLVAPAYQQGLAKVLLDAGLPIKLFGEGWDEAAGFMGAWNGVVRTREAFTEAVRGASVLIYPWPARSRQQIDAFGRTVVFAKIPRTENWVREARAALSSSSSPVHSPAVTLALLNQTLS